MELEDKILEIQSIMLKTMKIMLKHKETIVACNQGHLVLEGCNLAIGGALCFVLRNACNHMYQRDLVYDTVETTLHSAVVNWELWSGCCLFPVEGNYGDFLDTTYLWRVEKRWKLVEFMVKYLEDLLGESHGGERPVLSLQQCRSISCGCE